MIIFAPHNMLSDPPFETGPDQLQERDDLLPAGPAEDSVRRIPFRAEKRQFPFPWKKRDGGRMQQCLPYGMQRGKKSMYIKEKEKVDEFVPSSFSIPNISAVSAPHQQCGRPGERRLQYGSTYIQFLEEFLPRRWWSMRQTM